MRKTLPLFISPALLAAVLILVLPRLLRTGAHRPDDHEAGVDTYREVYALAKRTAYREVPDEELIAGAANGMLKVIDRYSRAYDPKQWQRFQRRSEGRALGVGIIFTRLEGGVRILRIMPNSPASRADLRPGDKVIAVDDDVLPEDADATLLQTMLEGATARKIRLKLEALSDGSVRTVTVVRGTYATPSILTQWLEEEQVLYLKCSRFHEETDEEIARALIAAEDRHLAGIVLDLRDNSGGSLSGAVGVVSAFAHPPVVVVAAHRDRRVDYPPSASPVDMETPLCILVDEHSASASEVVAGALQDLMRGTVVGTRTFGKGVMQNIYALRTREMGVKLTTARWLTPSGRSVQQGAGGGGGGIIPDVFASRPKSEESLLGEWWSRLDVPDELVALMEKDESRVHIGPRFRDSQLAVALKVLKGEPVLEAVSGS